MYKYRVAAFITEYHIVSKIIFPRIIIYLKMYVKNQHFKMDNHRVATLSTVYPTTSVIILPSLKLKGAIIRCL